MEASGQRAVQGSVEEAQTGRVSDLETVCGTKLPIQSQIKFRFS